MITKKCTTSGQEFTITESDLDFYAKMEIISKTDLAKLKSREISNCVGLPTLCPDERNRRRMSWRNDRKFYQRKCDKTGKPIISMYPSDSEYIVYHQSEWYKDDWNAEEYGQDFDFSRDFFLQFSELIHNVPRLGMDIVNCENSDYCNFCGDNKNCYLDIAGEGNEDCFFNLFVKHSRNCLDNTFVYNSELVYESIQCYKCYDVTQSNFLENCHNCDFCVDLKGCSDCLFSFNLRRKKYCIMNKQYTREGYQEKLKEFKKSSYDFMKKYKKKFKEMKEKYVVYKNMMILNSEDCVGNNINNSKNSHFIFNASNCEDSKYLYDVLDAKDCYDLNYSLYKPELAYEIISTLNMKFSAFSMASHYCSNTFYSDQCNNSQDLFGCSGLNHKKYCILNKQYSKEDYLKLREKIISHMKKTGEWGEFFPINLSPFAYNETVADEYYPLNKEEILAKNLKFREEKQNFKYDGPKYEIPAKIEDVDDEICTKILTCEATGKYYKIQSAELKFYSKMNLPIPRFCPDERHKRRMALRNPRKLFFRECAECQTKIQTTFAENRPEKVLCEECYLKEIN